ncbi:MAG: energy-coupling factor transporter transmembrane component T family protein [Nitrososphaeria archaeon]
MKSKSLTHRFLETLAETVDLLNSGVNRTDLNPITTVFSAFILTMVATFSPDFRLQMLIFFIGVGMILLNHTQVYEWAKITLLVSLWAVIVTIPIPIITSGETIVKLPIGFTELKISREGVNAVAAFTLRVLASTAILTSFTTVMGWRGIIRGLEGLRVPKEITSLFKISITNMPLIFRDTSRMLSAREARAIRNLKFRESWTVLSTVVGDILVRGFERASRLEKAVTARSFANGSQKHDFNVIGKKDLALLLLTVLILTFWVLEMW